MQRMQRLCELPPRYVQVCASDTQQFSRAWFRISVASVVTGSASVAHPLRIRCASVAIYATHGAEQFRPELLQRMRNPCATDGQLFARRMQCHVWPPPLPSGHCGPRDAREKAERATERDTRHRLSIPAGL